jgi:hypothetical protein
MSVAPPSLLKIPHLSLSFDVGDGKEMKSENRKERKREENKKEREK